tara:strand:- start:59 stop:385 length:327 start_codon:yes stop_codon:yes gene_type:complete
VSKYLKIGKARKSRKPEARKRGKPGNLKSQKPGNRECQEISKARSQKNGKARKSRKPEASKTGKPGNRESQKPEKSPTVRKKPPASFFLLPSSSFLSLTGEEGKEKIT